MVNRGGIFHDLTKTITEKTCPARPARPTSPPRVCSKSLWGVQALQMWSMSILIYYESAAGAHEKNISHVHFLQDLLALSLEDHGLVGSAG